MVQKKQANINILVQLDENKIPEKLIWSAPDGGVKNKISKAIFLSIWDHKNRESLSIDLWTKEMPIDEMNEFFYEVFILFGFYTKTSTLFLGFTMLVAFSKHFFSSSRLPPC